jgi:hypothetical protein
MTKKEFVEDLIKQKKSPEEIVKALEKGDKAKGITPAGKPVFAKLIYGRIMKQIEAKK